MHRDSVHMWRVCQDVPEPTIDEKTGIGLLPLSETHQQAHPPLRSPFSSHDPQLPDKFISSASPNTA